MTGKMSEEEFYRWIAQEIKDKRELARLKTKELAKKVEVDPTFISKIESGSKLSAYRFYEILYELGYTLAVVEKKKIYHIDVPEEERNALIDVVEEVDEEIHHIPSIAEEEFFTKWSRFKAKFKALLDVDVETILEDFQKDVDLQREAAHKQEQES